jgi:type II secretory pathway component GspD/PulD (secretin)
MTAADQIAANLRDAFRAIAVLDVPATVRAYLRRAHEANDFDSAMSNALATIVALDDAEAAAAAEVKAAQARMATITEANAKAREALRQALDACGGPGAAEAESEFHKARLQRGGAKVEITAPDALPEDFWRIKREPDKALVKALLAKGQTIPGAALVQSPPSLVITAKDR